MSDLVTIASLRNPIIIEIAINLLEEYNIEVFSADGNVSKIYGGGLIPTRIQVLEENVDEATEILQSNEII
ncbi:MAG: DUF2007 domain-containing protein [Candidatus Cloacimonadota bacterium]|nr:DUF2007 domain-containing protein [Candidatus Cloacimonadota bacterium]